MAGTKRARQSRLEWRGLDAFVGDGKQILFGLSGSIQSGEMLAVMGGSGSGKTTLFNAMSGRANLNEQHLKGELALNGKKFSVRRQRTIRALCCFVAQSVILCPTQTVAEALMFYAKLKLPSATTPSVQNPPRYATVQPL